MIFALDAGASRDTPGDPVVRVSLVDADGGEPVAREMLDAVRPLKVLPAAG